MKWAIELIQKSENKEQTLEALKKTFTISVASFDMMQTITNCLGQSSKSYMHVLHECMLIELKKDNPSDEHIIELLQAMEEQANINN